MSALKRLAALPRPRPARTRFTVAQFLALMAAMRELPPDDEGWRDEVPAYPLPAAPLTTADYSYFPF